MYVHSPGCEALNRARQIEPAPRVRAARGDNDTFLGYDFSAGYTSLERDPSDDEPDGAEPGPGTADDGLLTLWRRRRAARRAAAEAGRDAAAEADVDRLLAKISADGADSLTYAERRTLRKATARFRTRR